MPRSLKGETWDLSAQRLVDDQSSADKFLLRKCKTDMKLLRQFLDVKVRHLFTFGRRMFKDRFKWDAGLVPILMI